MIVGQDRAGKTSLMKHLLGLPFDPREPSTVGIEMQVVELTEKNVEKPWISETNKQLMTTKAEARNHVLKEMAQIVKQNSKCCDKKRSGDGKTNNMLAKFPRARNHQQSLESREYPQQTVPYQKISSDKEEPYDDDGEENDGQSKSIIRVVFC